MFIPDIPEKINNLKDNIHRIRWSVRLDIRAIIKAYEIFESQFPIQHMSDEESWATMPSYEDWLNGKRMPSVFPKTIGNE